ncbi:MAG: NGG1p interacting factor 3 protein [Chitinophagaceae bacterium]|nr:NGG1p interacting factor 3 protein [Chitinophagaceae bacterium]
MKISDVISFLESLADPALQENYDNAGLIIGNDDRECRGILVSLDGTEEVIQEAILKKCNLIVAHHPIIFSGLKKINGKNYVEKAVIAAIKNDIAIYAIHTNLDNIAKGVSGRMAYMLGLEEVSVLAGKKATLKKLITFVPVDHADGVRDAIFAAGAGYIGNYSDCSFNAEGTGTFKGEEGTSPYVGEVGTRHYEKEIKIETIFPFYQEDKIISALKDAHPYEEVAYDIHTLSNSSPEIGSGLVGILPQPMDEINLLTRIKEVFNVPVIRHTELSGRPVEKVALCGGSGSFLITNALAAGADFFITADVKYHEFFDANNRMVIADIGHYESEQFTINLLQEFLEQKFPNFAVLKTEVDTNPVQYF